jgi:hypothetical protein
MPKLDKRSWETLIEKKYFKYISWVKIPLFGKLGY